MVVRAIRDNVKREIKSGLRVRRKRFLHSTGFKSHQENSKKKKKKKTRAERSNRKQKQE